MRYVVTNQRIIFQFWKWGKIKRHAIYFDNLKGFTPSYEPFETYGTIYLLPKRMQEIDFDTYSLANGDHRSVPTLEMIEDVEKVTEELRDILRQSIP